MKVTALGFHGVSRRFGQHMALRQVSVRFEAGQVILLLGPNGAGKTTLLNMASTLLPPTQGQIVAHVQDGDRALSLDLMALASVRRDFVGLVSHASLLYDDLTGLENLELFCRLYGLPDAQALSQSMLTRMDLEHAADRRVSEYSRGMRQRLSIARALLQNPSLVLFDEPFTGLDQDGRRIVCDVLRELRTQGCLILLITHHLTLPEDVVDRALLLKGGRVVRDGDPREEGLGVWYQHGLEAA